VESGHVELRRRELWRTIRSEGEMLGKGKWVVMWVGREERGVLAGRMRFVEDVRGAMEGRMTFTRCSMVCRNLNEQASGVHLHAEIHPYNILISTKS